MFWAFIMNAQNQLPIANAALESIDTQTNSFSFWSNLQTNGGQVNYFIENENLIPGSTKAQKSQIISLGTSGWHVKTQSDYLCQVETGQTETGRFWAKGRGASCTTRRAVCKSDNKNRCQGHNNIVGRVWNQMMHKYNVKDRRS